MFAIKHSACTECYQMPSAPCSRRILKPSCAKACRLHNGSGLPQNRGILRASGEAWTSVSWRFNVQSRHLDCQWSSVLRVSMENSHPLLLLLLDERSQQYNWRRWSHNYVLPIKTAVNSYNVSPDHYTKTCLSLDHTITIFFTLLNSIFFV